MDRSPVLGQWFPLAVCIALDIPVLGDEEREPISTSRVDTDATAAGSVPLTVEMRSICDPIVQTARCIDQGKCEIFTGVDQ
jgi:hypothetical protein